MAVMSRSQKPGRTVPVDERMLRHVRTRVRSPQTNGVVERFFGSRPETVALLGRSQPA